MGDYYSAASSPRIVDFYRATPNGWREAQVGAIAACVAHATQPTEPGIVTMPTGSGKTAVELALPHLFAVRRTLVLVPTSLLRDQAAQAFRQQEVLRRTSLIDGDDNPHVLTVTSQDVALEEFQSSDVVVAIPQTLAGYLSSEQPLPDDLFDLVIVDEAHHAPAATWERVISHFGAARIFLFTATPRRRDGKRLPGELIYNYSVRAAIAAGMFNPIAAKILSKGEDATKDTAIVDAVKDSLASPKYEHVPVLARANTIDRAAALSSLYRAAGLTTELYHSKLTQGARDKHIRDWRAGRVTVLVGVDALSEGVDFPDLRILAYHDKHKSDAATMQQIGRLARRSTLFPVESMVIVHSGGDEYPALRGALSMLYDEDADWAELLPGLIDGHVQADKALREYAADFSGYSPEIDLKAIRPLGVVELREQRTLGVFEPRFYTDDRVQDDFRVGTTLAGYRITLSQRSLDQRSIYLCLAGLAKPTWSDDDALATIENHLCVLSWHRDPSEAPMHRSVLGITCTDNRIKNRVLELVDPDEHLTMADVGRLQRVLDAVPRMSVSNVGIRNTSGIEAGVAQYENYSGRGVDRGLGAASMGLKALGHVMIQIPGEGRSVNAGIAVEKGKYWELRHFSLVEYWSWLTALVSHYWEPGDPLTQRLLPSLARGSSLSHYPDAPVVHAEPDPDLFRDVWRLKETGTHVGDLSIEVEFVDGCADIWATDIVRPQRLFVGRFIPGSVEPKGSETCEVWRGAGPTRELGELFVERPPTIWLSDGRTVRGSVVYERPHGSRLVDDNFVDAWDWSEINIRNEADRSRPGERCVHDRVDEHLLQEYGSSQNTWIFFNDGPNELADHIVVHRRPLETAHVELWHSKASKSAKPKVAAGHFQELIAQGIKNRRWIIDTSLWSTLGQRLPLPAGAGASPPLKYIGGAPLADFYPLVGAAASQSSPDFSKTLPFTTGEVVLVQPGLSKAALGEALYASADHNAQKLIDLLSVARQVINDVGAFRVVSSK